MQSLKWNVKNWFSCHFLILIRSDTAHRKCFISFLPPTISVCKESHVFPYTEKGGKKRGTWYPTKTNIFLQPNSISLNIWQDQAAQFWRSLVSCADWLLKCKTNLYLTDVKNMTLWNNDRVCNRLVVVLSKWNEWSFGANSLKKWQHDY